MSKWITDRRPTEEDCKGATGTPYENQVWVNVLDDVVTLDFFHVETGVFWHPIVIEKPKPYVAPKSKPTSKCSVWHEPFDFDKKYKWYVLCNGTRLADNIPTREAAERIAAIYNEVMP